MCPQLSYPQITDSYPNLLERYLKPKLSGSSRIRTLDRWEVLFCRWMLNRYSTSCWVLQVAICDLTQGLHIPDEKVESQSLPVLGTCGDWSENSVDWCLITQACFLRWWHSKCHHHPCIWDRFSWGSFRDPSNTEFRAQFQHPMLHIIIPVFFISLSHLHPWWPSCS